MKYLYILENREWNYDNKFKYGFTENPKQRIISEQHSYKSIFICLYECSLNTNNYIYSYKEYDKIISELHHKTIEDIEIMELEYALDLTKFKEIKYYLINDGGGTEFIRGIEGIELLDFIFINIYKDLGINIRKLSRNEIDNININIINNIKPIEIEKQEKIKLRNYQINIIKELINYSKIYLELATGAGKSTIAYYLFNNIINKNKDIPFTIIILTPRINISSQNILNKYINIIKNSKKINIYYKYITSFDNTSYNIISLCIQSYQYLYHTILKFDINNIIIWFDESHYAIENWIHHKNYIKDFFLNDNERIKYRLFTSASPNKSIISNNSHIFGKLYSPISVRQLINDKWLAPIKPHIIDLNYNDIDINENDNKKYYYYTNTILNAFKSLQKTIGLNFHNNSKNATFAFLSHYNKFIDNKTNIKPYLLLSSNNIYSKLDSNYKYLLDFNHFNNENNNAIAYIVGMYNMGYDNPKIDFLSFADPKLSNKDIIQSIGRGIRSDSLDIDGKNLKKKNDIIIPIYNNNNDNNDIYIKFSKIKEILQYLIYDCGLDINDFNINLNKNKYQSNFNFNYSSIDLAENKIIADIINWDIQPIKEKWNITNITNHLMNVNIHNYSSYIQYISLDINKELNLPLELFKDFPKFNFNDTYLNNSSPYYNRDDCINVIKTLENDLIDNEEIDKNNNIELFEFLNNSDKKIPNECLWYFYGGSYKDFIIF